MAVEEKSPWGLLRGNGANVLRIIPTAMIQLIIVGYARQELMRQELMRQESDAKDG